MLTTVTLTEAPFWYIRHGETDWNRDGLIQGNTDVPLNETGWAQARAACQTLANRGITKLWCSPLQRARNTAEVIANALAVPLEVSAALREASFGAEEGKPMGDWFTHWSAGEVSPEGGEAFADLRVRAVTAVNAVLAQGGLPLVVAHGGFFRAIRAAMGLSAAVRTANGVPVLCQPGPDGWQLVTT
jgi:probable phosphoglycerate mutase